MRWIIGFCILQVVLAVSMACHQLTHFCAWMMDEEELMKNCPNCEETT